MNENTYQKKTKNPFWLRYSFLKKMPATFFAGITVKEFTNEKAVTTLRYNWLTQNPFNSIYFACLSMAAEYSTAILMINHL